MPELLLLRHAKSEWGDADLRDIDRPLAPRGQRDAPLIGAVLADTPPDALWRSPARRVIETVAGLREGFADLPDAREVESLYGASAGTLLRLVQEVDCDSLLVVAHNPGLHEMAVLLTDGDANADRTRLMQKFPTAALARIAFDGPWSGLDWGQGRLIGFTVPKDL